MRLRPFAIVTAAAALLSGACSFHFTGDGDHFFFSDLERATREESQPLDLAGAGTLEIDGLCGDVRVRVEPAGTARVEAKWTAFAREKAQAQATLDRSSLRFETIVGGESPTLRLSAVVREDSTAPSNPFYFPDPDVDLAVTLPAEVALVITTRYGDVDVNGPVTTVSIEAPHGDVRVVDARATRVTTSSGKVRLERIRGRVDVTTAYDSVELEDVEGPVVQARSSSGSILLRNARADRVKLDSSYDDIVVDRVAPLGRALEVAATTSSGAVRVDHGGDGSWRLATSYGDVVVRDLSGRLEARTNSGAIRVEGFHGEVDARTDYDDVSIEGELHGLVAQTSSGRLRVVARAGSRVEHPWRLQTRYDDVELDLPADLDAELDASTTRGAITGDFDVKVTHSDHHASARVKLGAGGPSIRVETTNGDIRVLRR